MLLVFGLALKNNLESIVIFITLSLFGNLGHVCVYSNLLLRLIRFFIVFLTYFSCVFLGNYFWEVYRVALILSVDS